MHVENATFTKHVKYGPGLKWGWGALENSLMGNKHKLLGFKQGAKETFYGEWGERLFLFKGAMREDPLVGHQNVCHTTYMYTITKTCPCNTQIFFGC